MGKRFVFLRMKTKAGKKCQHLSLYLPLRHTKKLWQKETSQLLGMVIKFWNELHKSSKKIQKARKSLFFFWFRVFEKLLLSDPISLKAPCKKLEISRARTCITLDWLNPNLSWMWTRRFALLLFFFMISLMALAQVPICSGKPLPSLSS